MSHALAIIVLAIISVVISVFIKDDERAFRGFCNAAISLLIVVLVWGYLHRYGVFGDAISLDHKCYYHILSVTPLGENSTALIILDSNGSIAPIRIFNPVLAITNSLYLW